MQKKSILLVFSAIVLVLFSATISSAVIEVNSYEELYKVLPGGMEFAGYNTSVVEKAQKMVVDRQLLKRKLRIKFIKPIQFLSINEKYFSIAFDVVAEPRKKTVFVLLFEKAGENRIAYPKNIYLSWLGPRDIKLFQSLTVDDLAKSFRNMGVADCHSDFVRPKIEKVFATKANLGHKHTELDLEGIIPEGKIDSAITRDAELKVKMDMYVVALEKRIAELEKTVNELKTTFKGVKRKGSTLVFNNMNVQITNGKGSTSAINGRGNLIVGYNESRGGDSRKGSHNVVVGGKNNFSSYGGIVSGNNNSLSGKYSFVGGGHDNTASGDYSAITCGAKNNAKGKYSAISGQVGRTKVDSGQNKHFKKK